MSKKGIIVEIKFCIKGDHLDLYATTRRRWRAWERIHPTRSWFTAILNHPRCYHLPGAPGGGLLGDVGPDVPSEAPTGAEAPTGTEAPRVSPTAEAAP